MNAGILAAKILAAGDDGLSQKLEQYQQSLKDKVLGTVTDIRKIHPNGFDD